MNVDVGLAKKVYCIENKITSPSEIAKISLQFSGIDKKNQAIFEVYLTAGAVPITWALTKIDVAGYEIFKFPVGITINPLSVANFINNKSGIGMKYDDIEFIHELTSTKYQVMMSVDSMYFTNYFIMYTA